MYYSTLIMDYAYTMTDFYTLIRNNQTAPGDPRYANYTTYSMLNMLQCGKFYLEGKTVIYVRVHGKIRFLYAAIGLVISKINVSARGLIPVFENQKRVRNWIENVQNGPIE